MATDDDHRNGHSTPFKKPKLPFLNITAEFSHHDPTVARINNGNFGSCPSSVLSAQQNYQLLYLRQPDSFYFNHLKPNILCTHTLLKTLINADHVDEIAIVDWQLETGEEMIFPVLKLGTLAVRTLAKPIAARLKADAGLHPMFRQFIINVAQANHRFSTIMQRKIYGRANNIAIRPLNEERAVEAAAAMLGEFFVFTVAGAAIIYEVQKNSKSEARKEEKCRQELEEIRRSNIDLAREVDHLRHKMEEMSNRSIFDIFRFQHEQAFEAQSRKVN